MSDKKIPEDLTLPDVEILLTNFIGILGNKAYDCLGLLPKEGKKTDVNIKQAKLAIDAMSVLCDQILPVVDEQHKQEIRNMLSSVRMAYVQKAGSYVPGK